MIKIDLKKKYTERIDSREIQKGDIYTHVSPGERYDYDDFYISTGEPYGDEGFCCRNYAFMNQSCWTGWNSTCYLVYKEPTFICQGCNEKIYEIDYLCEECR